MTVFPTVTDTRRMQMFADRPGPARVLIDTDAANEIDDQFAIAWAMLSPDRMDVEAIVAAPYGHLHMREELVAEIKARQENSGTELVEDKYETWVTHLIAEGIDPDTLELTGPAEGMELSYEEIITVLDKMGLGADGLVYRGSDRYMPAADTPVQSEGAERIIEAALADDERVLFVVAIGAVTNVASALLMAPEIAGRMVVTWTSGYPTWTDLSNRPSLNLVQDSHASRLLFSSGVPLVYLPGYHIGAQLRFSLPEMEAWIEGQGEIGDYLFHLYTNNPIRIQRGITPFPGQSWIIWDLINVAWLIDRSWVPTRATPTPRLDESLRWRARPDGPLILEAVGIDRDAIYHDLIVKLADRERILSVGTAAAGASGGGS
ncbi:MAG: nucleoside hydrolase [bacterium]|nr:nucleoside hydrolase [bacterium]MDE0287072.1 nucleoside hydrolase [bacterium]MDE0440111.1 nucleoside hydrolase [bacterium]